VVGGGGGEGFGGGRFGRGDGHFGHQGHAWHRHNLDKSGEEGNLILLSEEGTIKGRVLLILRIWIRELRCRVRLVLWDLTELILLLILL
jgi:hypothetical protein